MYFPKLPQFSHNAVWGGVAHRQADGREYHPLRWSAGMRVCGHVGEQAYSKIAYEQARVWKEILRLPCRAALEDGRAGRISMSLDFFGTFLVKQKSAEKCHEHYPELKIINMNGRLYDPVIGRFFSPDKYVANSSFSQDFNRYSYARNNPLKYSDPSGENLWDVISTVLFFPARVLSETFQWINDKINGDSHPGGYFNYGYMTNQTAPGSTPPHNPVNAIPFGQPGYMSPGANWGDMGSVRFGTGWSMGADNEWNRYAIDFALSAPERKIGSLKLIYIPKYVAASLSENIRDNFSNFFKRFTLGIYAGKFHGTNVFETNKLGTLEESQRKWSGGVTLPPLGIIVGKGVKSKNYDEDLLKHEFGHKLQYDLLGFEKYYECIATNSSLSAYQDRKDGWKHKDYWTETWANYLSREYFGFSGWDISRFPVQNINQDIWLKLFNY